MKKSALFIVGLIGFSTPCMAELDAREVNRIYLSNKQKNDAIMNDLRAVGITTQPMIDAWEIVDNLSGRPPSEISTADKKKWLEAKRLLADYTAKAPRDSQSLVAQQQAVRNDINQLKTIKKETGEALAWAKNHPEEIKRFAANNPANAQTGDKSGNSSLPEQLNELQNNVRDTQIEALETSAELDKIESKYDRQELGAYFADKLAQFMNSDSFCRAKNHCANPKTEDPVDPSFLYKEIFPDITDNLKRKGARQTYDKVHGRTKKAGTKPSATNDSPSTEPADSSQPGNQ